MERRIVFKNKEDAKAFEKEYDQLVDKYSSKEDKLPANVDPELEQATLEMVKNIPVPKQIESGIGSMSHFMIDAFHDMTIKAYKCGFMAGMEYGYKVGKEHLEDC